MDILSKKFVLQAALDKSFGVAAKTGTNSALQHVLAECEENILRLTGSDGELSIIVSCEQLDVEQTGNAIFPPSLHDIVKSCADADIHIRTTEAMIYVDCADAHWEVRQEKVEYPTIVEEHSNEIAIPKEELSAALNRCRPAIASESIRNMFAFIQVKDGKMRATDGSKYHQVDFPYHIDGLIPSRAVQEVLRRIRAMAMETVGIGQNERCYTFQFDSDLLIVTKHNVEYPDVDTHMLQPALENDQRLSVERERLTDAVKRVALTADEDTKYLTIELIPGRMTLSSLDKYGNNSREPLDIHWEGGERKMGVNHSYLMDVISALEGPDVLITIGEDHSPRLSSLCFQQEGFIGVLVQLRADLGAAAQGSDRVRPAQQAPIGWGEKGLTATTSRSGGRRTRRAAQQAQVVARDDEDLSSVLEDDKEYSSSGAKNEEDV